MDHAHLITMNDNVLTALDVETSGRCPYRNEVIQIALVPLDVHLNPVDQFYTNIRPQYPDRMHPDAVSTHGLTVEALMSAPDVHEVCDSLCDWFERLQLAPGKRLLPLCHNAQFDIPFIQEMLGHELFNEIFGYPTRDTQGLVTAVMDKAAFNGIALPFDYANLGHCCEREGVSLNDAHDALADALATARLYKKMLGKGTW